MVIGDARREGSREEAGIGGTDDGRKECMGLNYCWQMESGMDDVESQGREWGTEVGTLTCTS